MKNAIREKIKKRAAMVVAMVLAVSIATVAVYASVATRNANLSYNNIRITLNGNEIIPTDANGNAVEPFIIDGTTYLPVRGIASALGLNVEWDGANNTVVLKSANAPGASTPVVTPGGTPKGTLMNPYSAADGAVIEYQEYSFYPKKQVSVTCTNVIRGEQANLLAKSENMFNADPTADTEWVFMEFNVTYISSEGGYDDVLEASDIIYNDRFYTTSGASIRVQDMASLSDKYKGYGVFDVELYPGASGKVVIGLLTEKNVGDIVLKVPYSEGDKNHWILCTK